MSRPKKATPMRKLHTSLPEPLLTQVDLVLFSEIEGRVPHGAYAGLLTKLLEDFLARLKGGGELS